MIDSLKGIILKCESKSCTAADESNIEQFPGLESIGFFSNVTVAIPVLTNIAIKSAPFLFSIHVWIPKKAYYKVRNKYHFIH